MRVLVVTTWLPTPASPSTGAFVARDVAALSSRYDVHVLHLCAPSLLGPAGAGGSGGGAADGRGVEGLAGVSVERLAMDPRRPDHVFRARGRVRAVAAGADLVHTMAVSALLPMTGRRPGVPWVHTEHWSGLLAPETLTPALRAARPGVLRLLRRPDVVAVVSEHLAAGVREVRQGPVVVVPNIVDAPDVVLPRRDAGSPLVAPAAGDGPGPSHPARRGPLEVVGVGGLIPRKDPLAAVGAVAELRRRGVDARLTWVGEGPLRGQGEALAAELDVPLALTGPVRPEQVQEIVGAADVFLLPTHAETFCVAAAEALAAGRPVVVGDSGGPRDFVAPPSGLLVTPGAPAPVWANAVERVWAASADLPAEEIAAPVVEAYGARSYAARVAEVYDGLVRRGRDTGPSGGPVSPGQDGSASPDRDEPSPGRHGGEPADQQASPLVDVVVATHSAQRQTERAVRSVLDGSQGVDVRVTVVCHGLAASDVAASWSRATREDPRARLLEHHDGVPSPAGPFTAGLDAATAPWVSIMGSDDQVAHGALRNWLDVAAATGAEVVLAEVRLDGTTVATPPTRLGVRPGRARRRAEGLDLVRDRLAYRSAPLGLLSREAIARTGARLLPGARTGEDVPFVTRLFEGARVALAEGTPYLVGTDAQDRATAVPRPVREELVAVTALLDDPWFAGLPPARRRAVATKLLRIHVFGTVLNRPDPAWWTPQERDDLGIIAARLVREVPGAHAPLSLADRDLLAAVLDPAVPAGRMVELARARRRHGTPRTLLPHDWSQVLHREAPLRFMAASLAARRSRSRRSSG